MASVTSSVGRTLIFFTKAVKRVEVNFLFQLDLKLLQCLIAKKEFGISFCQ